MWNTAVQFGHTVTTRDEDGFVHSTTEWGSPVRASALDITRAESTLAMQCGYDADRTYEVHKVNYANEHFLRDQQDGQIYDIERTYNSDRANMISLTCSKRERGKEAHDVES